MRKRNSLPLCGEVWSPVTMHYPGERGQGLSGGSCAEQTHPRATVHWLSPLIEPFVPDITTLLLLTGLSPVTVRASRELDLYPTYLTSLIGRGGY